MLHSAIRSRRIPLVIPSTASKVFLSKLLIITASPLPISSSSSMFTRPNFSDDFRDGFGDDNYATQLMDEESSLSSSFGGMDGENDGDDSSLASLANKNGPNPADYASSGIHGPAATVARRDSNPDSIGKHAHEFHNEKMKRCVLCDEPIGSWMGHVVFVSHQARLAIVERVMSGACGPPDKVVDRWWQLLNVEPEGMQLNRIRSLSSDVNSATRKERLTYLLRFLQANGVLKVALGVFDSESNSFGRSNVFERFEMVGDNVVKVVFYDRLQSLFPLTDGGATGKMAQIQQLIDSNEGLLQAFDYLELDKIIGTSLSQSKFKSDVMEALFGELQTYLWAVTHHWNSPVEYSAINAAAGPELQYIEAVVRHTLLELTDCILMFAVESSVTRSMGLLKKEYKGSKQPKPIPLSKSETERRMMMKRLQRQKRMKEAEMTNTRLRDDYLLAQEGKYSFKPFLTADVQPIPPEELFGEGSSSASSSSSFGSSIGVSVIKPLAQRLAEEAEKRRLKEATWRIPAPYFSVVSSSSSSSSPNDKKDSASAFRHFHNLMVSATGEDLDQKEVKISHLKTFVAENNINNNDVSEQDSLMSNFLQLEKEPRKRREKEINGGKDVVMMMSNKSSCAEVDPLVKEEVQN